MQSSSSAGWALLPPHSTIAESEAASELWLYGLRVARAGKSLHIWTRFTGGAGATKERGDVARAAGRWVHTDPLGESWQRGVAAAYVWIGSDMGESSHPKALDM